MLKTLTFLNKIFPLSSHCEKYAKKILFIICISAPITTFSADFQASPSSIAAFNQELSRTWSTLNQRGMFDIKAEEIKRSLQEEGATQVTVRFTNIDKSPSISNVGDTYTLTYPRDGYGLGLRVSGRVKNGFFDDRSRITVNVSNIRMKVSMKMAVNEQGKFRMTGRPEIDFDYHLDLDANGITGLIVERFEDEVKTILDSHIYGGFVPDFDQTSTKIGFGVHVLLATFGFPSITGLGDWDRVDGAIADAEQKYNWVSNHNFEPISTAPPLTSIPGGSGYATLLQQLDTVTKNIDKKITSVNMLEGTSLITTYRKSEGYGKDNPTSQEVNRAINEDPEDAYKNWIEAFYSPDAQSFNPNNYSRRRDFVLYQPVAWSSLSYDEQLDMGMQFGNITLQQAAATYGNYSYYFYREPLQEQKRRAMQIAGITMSEAMQQFNAREQQRVQESRQAREDIMLSKALSGAHDSALFTGVYLGGLAHRYSVERAENKNTQDVLEQIDTVLTNVERLFEIHGNTGLLARLVTPTDTFLGQMLLKKEQQEIADAQAAEAAGEIFKGNLKRFPKRTIDGKAWIGEAHDGISRDMYVGIYYGLSSVYNFVDNDSFQSRARALLEMSTDYLIANDWVITDDRSYKGGATFWANTPYQKITFLTLANQAVRYRDTGLNTEYGKYQAELDNARKMLDMSWLNSIGGVLNPTLQYYKTHLFYTAMLAYFNVEKNTTYRNAMLKAATFKDYYFGHHNNAFNRMVMANYENNASDATRLNKEALAMVYEYAKRPYRHVIGDPDQHQYEHLAENYTHLPTILPGSYDGSSESKVSLNTQLTTIAGRPDHTRYFWQEGPFSFWDNTENRIWFNQNDKKREYIRGGRADHLLENTGAELSSVYWVIRSQLIGANVAVAELGPIEIYTAPSIPGCIECQPYNGGTPFQYMGSYCPSYTLPTGNGCTSSPQPTSTPVPTPVPTPTPAPSNCIVCQPVGGGSPFNHNGSYCPSYTQPTGQSC